jgi:hypothetical protein
MSASRTKPGNQISLALTRLDTSKEGDTVAIVMKRGDCKSTPLPESVRPALKGWYGWPVRCSPDACGIAVAQCDDVRVLSASGMIARACLFWPAFTK